MENAKAVGNLRSLNHPGKHSPLPPKSPFPSIPHAYTDYSSNPAVGTRSIQRPKQGFNLHQRTSSESFALEEQPSWLDELLNEPDTPVRKGGHRRSSSDSFAYLEVADLANREYAASDHRFNNLVSIPSWGSQEPDPLRSARSFYGEMNSVANLNNKGWGNALNSSAQFRKHIVSHNSGMAQDGKVAMEKPNDGEYYGTDDKLSEKIDHSNATSEGDSKRAKQQFAQRSRVRKLQLIAELEKNVQALEADGSEVSAELEFLNQQNLILGMENKTLKQRLDSLAQEQLIKCMEQEVLEREIGRLRALYQQQQLQPQQPPARHRRNNSRDLDSQFANLSLKQKDNNSSKVLS